MKNVPTSFYASFKRSPHTLSNYLPLNISHLSVVSFSTGCHVWYCSCVVISKAILFPLHVCKYVQEICLWVQVELALWALAEFRAVTDHYINKLQPYTNTPCVFGMVIWIVEVHRRINESRSEQLQEYTLLNLFWHLHMHTYICFHESVALCNSYLWEELFLVKNCGQEGSMEHQTEFCLCKILGLLTLELVLVTITKPLWIPPAVNSFKEPFH